MFSPSAQDRSGDKLIKQVVPILCLVGVVGLLSSVTPIFKYIFQHSSMSVLSLACGRVVIGFLFLASITACIDSRGLRALRPCQVLQLTALGILGVGAYAVAAWGLMYTSVTHYALLYSLLPTITTLLSIYRGRDQATAATGCGILLSWAGCSLAVSGGTGLQEIGFGFGDALVLLFTLMMSGYIVLSPNIVKQFGVWTSNTTMFGTSALLLMAGTAAGGMTPQEDDLSVEVAGLLLFIGMATAGVFLLRSRALQSLTPATVGAYHNLIPICTIGLAHFILGEAVSTYTLLGGTAVVGGTELLRRASFFPHHTAESAPTWRLRYPISSFLPAK